MRLLQWISSILIISANAFTPILQPLNIPPRKVVSFRSYVQMDTGPSPTPTSNKLNWIQKKTTGFLKIIRYNTILPTACLSFAGGWLMNPSLFNLLQSSIFLVSTLNTILIMSSSMVINDIFDLEVDKINNPTRPLASGEVSLVEAGMYTITLLGSAIGLSTYFLPDHLQTIVYFSILNVSLYTPVFKKIPLVKNMFCAGLVSFSVFFGASSATTNYMEMEPNFDVLSITMSIVFFGSLYNELLLDMRDCEGDKANYIYTIPVLFGNTFSWIFANIILYFNITSNTLSLVYRCNCNTSFIVPILFTPIVVQLFMIRKKGYSKSSIKTALSKTNQTLFMLLVYLCIFVSNR